MRTIARSLCNLSNCIQLVGFMLKVNLSLYGSLWHNVEILKIILKVSFDLFFHLGQGANLRYMGYF